MQLLVSPRHARPVATKRHCTLTAATSQSQSANKSVQLDTRSSEAVSISGLECVAKELTDPRAWAQISPFIEQDDQSTSTASAFGFSGIAAVLKGRAGRIGSHWFGSRSATVGHGHGAAFLPLTHSCSCAGWSFQFVAALGAARHLLHCFSGRRPAPLPIAAWSRPSTFSRIQSVPLRSAPIRSAACA